MSAHWQAAARSEAQSMAGLYWHRDTWRAGGKEVLDTTSGVPQAPFSALCIVSTGCCEPGDPT
jgi:hypothetical protein